MVSPLYKPVTKGKLSILQMLLENCHHSHSAFIECRSLLGETGNSYEALSVVLHQHINNKAQLEKGLAESQATCARLQKDLARVNGQD
jgi:hypothetical protein